MAEEKRNLVTAEEMRSRMPVNIAVIDAVADLPNSLVKRIEDVASTEFIAEFNKFVKDAGYKKTPRIYQIENPKSNISIIQTLDGEPVLFITKDFLKFPIDKALALIPHEYEHYIKGHTTPEGVASRINDNQIGLQFETEADNAFAKLCRPSLAAAVFDKEIERVGNSIILDNHLLQPELPLTPQQIKLRVDEIQRWYNATHPLFTDRSKTMHAMPENTPGCIEITPNSTPVGKPLRSPSLIP